MSSHPFWTRRWQSVWLGLACALAAWCLAFNPLVAGIEDWMLDACFIGRGARASAARDRIVIVEIDEPYLQDLTRRGKLWIQSSPDLARVVRHLASLKAAAVGIDYSIPEELENLLGPQGEAAGMGLAIREAGNVVLPVWNLPERVIYPLADWRLAESLAEARAEDESEILPHLAFVNVQDDSDRFLRRQQLAAVVDGKPRACFALAVLAAARKLPLRVDDEKRLRLGDEVIPTDADHFVRINFAGPPGSFRRVRFADLLADAEKGKATPGLEGAMVLIGTTAAGFKDFHATPYSNGYSRWLPGSGDQGFMSGTELHAHTLAMLADRSPVHEPKWLALPLLLLVGGAMGWLFDHFRPGGVAFFAILHHFLWKAVAVAIFALFAARVPIVPMLALGVLLAAGTVALRWQDVRKSLRLLKSDRITRFMETTASQAGPVAQKRFLTVLFADIRGFTAFSEKRDPAQVVRLLNAYFDTIIPVIQEHGGTLNQFMGDGVMVIFGAPVPHPEHATQAVRAARAMVRAVRANRDQWEKLGFKHLAIGVGINTGEAVVGLIGSKDRKDYTAIGETTNLAARIEAANKDMKTEVLVSTRTYDELGEAAASLGCRPTPEPGKVKNTELLVHAVEVD